MLVFAPENMFHFALHTSYVSCQIFQFFNLIWGFRFLRHSVETSQLNL
ncbi:unnamed protein product [Ixodes pacificus]